METVKSDCLVIGSGGAGLRCAIELADNNVNVQIVGKCARRDAHTVLARGGINAALGNMDKGDSWQLHAADTIRDGGFINDTSAVTTLCKNSPNAIKELASWGCKFHREKNGEISQRFFGAASFRRACFVGDVTGKEILNTLVDQVLKRKIPFKSSVYITKLLTRDGRVNGALGINLRTGSLIVFESKEVVLCTGGHSRVFSRSSSRFWENTGDGIALADSVGASFMDMEMFQFHPTGMVHPKEAVGTLVTEAVRGEGGILVNSKGERFMKDYDSKRMELSARDVVARAIYSEIMQGRATPHKGVWLDISSKSKSYILKRLPKMYSQFKEFSGIDISKDKMEVGPTAHYSMGGIRVDHATGKTGIAGLRAIGEVTAGTHGGNRLGGNSLAEIVVFGKLVGKSIVKGLKSSKFFEIDEGQVSSEVTRINDLAVSRKGVNPIKLKESLGDLMWSSAGVVRDEKSLSEGLSELNKFRNRNFKIGGGLKMNEKLIAALDIESLISCCEMILLSALKRKESRAAHYRSDYPKTYAKFKKNIVCKSNSKGVNLSWSKVEDLPSGISKLLNKKISDSKAHHMLE